MSKIIKNSKNNFYVQKKKDFDRIHEVMHLMPSFALHEKGRSSFTDIYYETEDNFLAEMGVAVRLRVYKDKKIISVKYSDEVLEKQDILYKQAVHEREIEVTDDIKTQENLIFVEDKLSAIYSTRLNIDIMRRLRAMREVYLVKTKRSVYEVVHNSGFRANIHTDELVYINKLKHIEYKDLIVETAQTSFVTDLNNDLYEFFLAELRKKVLLVPMQESKYEAAKLFTRFKK
jgi:hypothetical protein